MQMEGREIGYNKHWAQMSMIVPVTDYAEIVPGSELDILFT